MEKLNFPEFDFQIITDSQSVKIYDIIRKRNVVLTPEEWVRQHIIRYLIDYKKYPQTLIQIEGSLKVGRMKKRCDVVAFNLKMEPILLVECKRTDVLITQETFDQVFRYNIGLNVPHMVITNGLNHYCFSICKVKQEVVFLEEIPIFE